MRTASCFPVFSCCSVCFDFFILVWRCLALFFLVLQQFTRKHLLAGFRVGDACSYVKSISSSKKICWFIRLRHPLRRSIACKLVYSPGALRFRSFVSFVMKQARNLSQIFNGKSISRNTTHRPSLNLKSILTGEMLKGQNKGRESKQPQDRS